MKTGTGVALVYQHWPGLLSVLFEPHFKISDLEIISVNWIDGVGKTAQKDINSYINIPNSGLFPWLCEMWKSS